MSETSAGMPLQYPRTFLPEGVDLHFNPGPARDGLLEFVKVRVTPHAEYEVTFITAERLTIEVERSRELDVPWFAKPAMIVVTEISAWIVDLAVRWAYSQDYFLQLHATATQNPKTCNAVLEFPRGLSRADEEEALERHYLQDGFAKLGDGSRRPAYFQTPARLRAEIESDALCGRPLFVEPGLIAVAEVRLEICLNAVSALGAEGFFDHLRPIVFES